jgi:leader peptidase (prepilin peptidase) / N-methyltransferase
VIGVRLRDFVYRRNLFAAESRPRATGSRLVHPSTTWSRFDWSTFELGFGAAALLACGVSLIAAPGGRGLLGAGLALVMIVIARIDARALIIPNALVVAALALGLCNAGLTSPGGILEGLLSAIARSAALAFLFFGLQAGYRWLRRREGLGSGDVKLAAAGGAWLDWATIPAVIEIAALAALSVYLLSYLAGKQRDGPPRLSLRLPFGLFLAPAIWLGWLLQSLSAPLSIELGN